MMSNEMMLYLFTRLDGIKGFFCVMPAVVLIGAVIVVLVSLVMLDYPYGAKEEEKEQIWVKSKKLRRKTKPFFIVGIIFILVSISIPSSKEMAFIYLGGKTITYVENSEDIKEVVDNSVKLPKNALKVLNGKMEEYLKDMDKVEVKTKKEGE